MHVIHLNYLQRLEKKKKADDAKKQKKADFKQGRILGVSFCLSTSDYMGGINQNIGHGIGFGEKDQFGTCVN